MLAVTEIVSKGATLLYTTSSSGLAILSWLIVEYESCNAGSPHQNPPVPGVSWLVGESLIFHFLDLINILEVAC